MAAENKKQFLEQAYEYFRRMCLSLNCWFMESKNFLVAGATEKAVLAKLKTELSRAWPIGTTFEIPREGNMPPIQAEVKERGVHCSVEIIGHGNKKQTLKGNATWVRLAEQICKGPDNWWDLNRLDATQGGQLPAPPPEQAQPSSMPAPPPPPGS
jgi:hypothetical protein